MTILTGANGAGKTTLLSLLSRHFGWSAPFVSQPGSTRSRSLIWLNERQKRREARLAETSGVEPIGSIRYTDDRSSPLLVPVSPPGPQYEVTLGDPQNVRGVYVPSHRPTHAYRRIESIRTEFEALDIVLERYLADLRTQYGSGGGPPASLRIKEALVSWAMFGPGNENVAPNPSAEEAFRDFNKLLRTVLPASLRFRRVRVIFPEVLLETASGDFSFDAMSGGVAAIIDLAWQIYLYSLAQLPFTVLIDEPENHLHPELQRSVLPTFLKAFPKLRFIVTTHNPLVVGSVEDSRVYVLRYTRQRRVVSDMLDLRTRAGTANEILRDVLGLETSIPDWALQETKRLVRLLSETELTPESASVLRGQLHQFGLDELLPTALEDWIRLRET